MGDYIKKIMIFILLYYFVTLNKHTTYDKLIINFVGNSYDFNKNCRWEFKERIGIRFFLFF